MSIRCVTIYYGPCNSFHTYRHKPQKLRGLTDRLQKYGYRVCLVPVIHQNYCVLEICAHEVFRCNLQNLFFNTPCHLDPVCQRAVEACLQGSAKLERAANYLWLWDLIESRVFPTTYQGPKDYWLTVSEELKPLSTCFDCVACVGYLAE